MDIELAEELTRQAYKAVEYLYHRAIPREDGDLRRPPTVEPAEDWDAMCKLDQGALFTCEEALGCTMATDGWTRGPYHMLTEGLAQAWLELSEMTAPASIRPHVDEALRLVDEALTALDVETRAPDALAAMSYWVGLSGGEQR